MLSARVLLRYYDLQSYTGASPLVESLCFCRIEYSEVQRQCRQDDTWFDGVNNNSTVLFCFVLCLYDFQLLGSSTALKDINSLPFGFSHFAQKVKHTFVFCYIRNCENNVQCYGIELSPANQCVDV